MYLEAGTVVLVPTYSRDQQQYRGVKRAVVVVSGEYAFDDVVRVRDEEGHETLLPAACVRPIVKEARP